MEAETRMLVLAEYLGIKEEDVENEIIETSHCDKTFEAEGCEYMVLTDDEADEYAKENIEQSVWAFVPNFIISHSEVLDYDDASEAIIKAIQEQCENGNEAMTKLIDNMEEFIEDAKQADGRGHFMNSYDGDEIEMFGSKATAEDMYIYRMN